MKLIDQINTALIGFGFSGSTFHAPFLRELSQYNLQSVLTSNPEKVHTQLPGTDVVSNFNKIINNPKIDLIVLTTPNNTHYPLAKEALEAGKHVVVDKPFTLHSYEALDLIEIADRQKKILTVYHNRRWDGDYLTIQKLLKEKTLGEIYLYEAHFHRYRPIPNPKRWKESDTLGSGLLYDLGSHLLDQALQLFGNPDAIHADITTQRPDSHSDDYFNLTLSYGPKRVILKASNLIFNPGPRYQIHGTKGSFLKEGMDPQEQDLMKGKSPAEKSWGEDNPENYGILKTEGQHRRIPTLKGNYANFYTSLASAIHEGSPSPVAPEEAYQVIQLLQLCRNRKNS